MSGTAYNRRNGRGTMSDSSGFPRCDDLADAFDLRENVYVNGRGEVMPEPAARSFRGRYPEEPVAQIKTDFWNGK